MSKTNLGQVCCAQCEKVIAHFPLESQPTEDLELYCSVVCAEAVEEVKD